MAEKQSSYQSQTGVSEEARFVLELEFIQCLASPQYLNWLAQNKYLEDKAFLNYLKYLEYWRQPQYAKYIRFPHCLFMLELLQSEHFRQAIALPQVAEEVHTQQAFYWQHYRTNRIKEAAAALTQQQGTATARVSQAVTKAAPARCDSKGFKPEGGKPLLYLYVWAGVANTVGQSSTNAPQPKDFVATIDLTEGSPCFGQIISEADVPTSGNEPHHVGLNQDGTVLGVGGFNSWLYDQPSLYFFDVASNPAQPKFIKSVKPEKGAVADDLIRLPNGGFLVSLMGNKQGGTSGRVAELDKDLNLVAEHPKSEKNIDNFNPHGLALTPAPINRFVTLDYVEYASTFKPANDVRYRTTARIWDQAQREILKVVDLGPKAKGMMTVRYLPNAGNKGLFFTSAGRGVLYLLDSLSGDVSEVYDAKVGDGHCVLTQPFANTTRILISFYTSNQVRLLDISNPYKLQELQNFDLPKNTGPHAIVSAPGDRLVALSNYYVEHNRGAGIATPFTDTSDKTVRLFTVAADGNSFAPHPKVPVIDFKSAFPHKGIARPHGMAFKAVPVQA